MCIVHCTRKSFQRDIFNLRWAIRIRMKMSNFGSSHVISFDLVNSMYKPGVTKKHQKFIFKYLVFSQKSYLNMWCFEKVHICIPKIPYLHT